MFADNGGEGCAWSICVQYIVSVRQKTAFVIGSARAGSGVGGPGGMWPCVRVAAPRASATANSTHYGVLSEAPAPRARSHRHPVLLRFIKYVSSDPVCESGNSFDDEETEETKVSYGSSTTCVKILLTFGDVDCLYIFVGIAV